MTRIFCAIILVFLAGCSFAPVRISVPDVELPAGSSNGRVCYALSTESAPANFRRATYRADATYESSSLIGEPEAVTLRVYGREAAPAGREGDQAFCADASDADIVLSDVTRLEPGETKPIEVGGGEYSGALADLIARPNYYLGASLAGSSFLEANQRIILENGSISVSF